MEAFNEVDRIAALQHGRKLSAHPVQQLGVFKSEQGIRVAPIDPDYVAWLIIGAPF